MENVALYFALVLIYLACFLHFKEVKDSDSYVNLILNNKCASKSNVTCLLEARKEINEWLNLDSRDQFTLLLTGKTGSGKTRFISGFIGKDAMPLVSEDESNLLPKTHQVIPYQYIYNDVKIILYDTPGLVDTENKISNGDTNHNYLKDMVAKRLFPDIVVFFIKMDDVAQNSLHVEDKHVIKNVTDAFGWARWRYALFVLSFANKVHKEGATWGDHMDQFHFNDIWNHLSLEINKLLIELHVQGEVVNRIPIIPVGLVSEPIIKADKRNISWVEQFWDKAFSILRFKSDDKQREESQMEIDHSERNHD